MPHAGPRYALRVLMKKPASRLSPCFRSRSAWREHRDLHRDQRGLPAPLDIEEPSRVVELFTRDTKTVQTGNFTPPSSLQNYEDYRDQNQVFTGLAGYFGIGLQWTRNGETQECRRYWRARTTSTCSVSRRIAGACSAPTKIGAGRRHGRRPQPQLVDP
jgi:hypothetical protein